MTPNFALSLAFDGIRLLHRVPGGWHLVGEVPIDAPNLAQELSMLRRTALSLDPKGLRTKILIPNDQIKYMALDGTRATEDDIHRALHGTTPYDLSELVVDNSRGGGRTYVAAVPKETLAEAEAFAVENKFSPVCFAAVPEPFTYQGEVFFGRTKAANDLLKSGETVIRDHDPVKIIGAVRLPKPDAVPEPDEVAVPAPAAEPPAAAVEETSVSDPDELAHDASSDQGDDTPAASTKDAEPAPELSDSAPQIERGSEVEAEVEVEAVVKTEATLSSATPTNPATPTAVAAPETVPVPAAGTLNAPDVEADAKAPVSDAQDPEQDMAEPAVAEDAGKDTPPAKSATPEPEVVFTSRTRSFRADDDIAPPSVRPAPAAPFRKQGEEVSFSSRHRNGADAAGQSRKEPPVLAVPKDPGTPTPIAPQIARSDSGRDLAAKLPPVTVAAPKAADAPAVTGRAADALPETQVSLGGATIGSGLSVDQIVPFSDNDAVLAPETAPKVAVTPAADAVSRVAPAVQNPVAPAKPPAKTSGLFRSRRKDGKRPTHADASPATEEANRLTVFGARKTPKRSTVGGKPRFLLLMLMLVLLLFMAAVALVASRTEGGLAALIGISGADPETTEVASLAPPVVVPVAIPAEPAIADRAPAQDAQTDTPDAALSPSPEGGDAATIDAMTAALTAAAQGQQPQDAAPASQTTVDTAVSQAGAVLLSPAEAQRLYEATGVWQWAARLPIIPRTEAAPEVEVASIDGQAKVRLTPAALPEIGSAAPDAVLALQTLPPGPDVTFDRDERGFIRATPEGTVLPDGLIVYAGSPSVLPVVRPGSSPAAPQIDLTAEDPAAPLDPTSPEIAAEAEAATLAKSPVLAALVDGPRPTPRPESLAPPPTTEPEPEPADPALGRKRPQPRPEALAPAAVEPEPVAAPEPDPAPGQAAAAAAAAASTVDVAAIADAIAASAPPDATASATQLAPAVSGRPDIRPRNFDRVVQAAQRAPEPAPAAEPTIARNATVAASGPVPGGVARAATEENAINLRAISLLGIRGSSSDRVAIVRQPNGRILSVKVGDRLDGGQITAIGEHALNYVKRGRTYTLEIGA